MDIRNYASSQIFFKSTSTWFANHRSVSIRFLFEGKEENAAPPHYSPPLFKFQSHCPSSVTELVEVSRSVKAILNYWQESG
jgi:hypothetical protein